MPRGKADRTLTVGKKLEILDEAERTGQLAVTANKYNVKPGQLRDWKRNEQKLRATDPSRLVCASNVQRGHLVFNESYAQYWVGYNKFCSKNLETESLEHQLQLLWKDCCRDGIQWGNYPTEIDPTAKHELEFPDHTSMIVPDDVTEELKKDLTNMREELAQFFDQQPFPTKYLYYVTRLDYVKPNPDEDEEEEEGEREVSINDILSFYVAVCFNGSVMAPMAIFPPVEPEHWERKKTIKLRHAHSMHREKFNDPNEALQFFSTTWKKYYDEEARYSDKFAFLLDKSVPEFSSDEFVHGVSQLDGYDKYWKTFTTLQQPLKMAHFEDIMNDFVTGEWNTVLGMKKSAQPNDYRKCVAFWFFTVWEMFAGENARIALRNCNMYLEPKDQWRNTVMGQDL